MGVCVFFLWVVGVCGHLFFFASIHACSGLPTGTDSVPAGSKSVSTRALNHSWGGVFQILIGGSQGSVPSTSDVHGLAYTHYLAARILCTVWA